MNISTLAVRRFNDLRPPSSLRAEYDRYVAAQEQVRDWDRDALAAANGEDSVAYLQAREARDNTAEERERLADAVGFKVCSQRR